jgi:hypothetical protein
MSEPVMTPSIEEIGAKLVEGTEATDFLPRETK